MNRARKRWLWMMCLVLLLFSLLLLPYFLLTRPYPQTDGTITLQGLTAPITIQRNEDGVPRITATTIEDLFFAQGFVHAQDRLFQMDVQRRGGLGTLAALIGRDGLPSDRLARALHYADHATAYATQFEEEHSTLALMLTAYSNGVNAYASEFPLPIEYQWLQASFDPWQPRDSLAVLLLYNHQLMYGAEERWLQAHLRQRLGQNDAEFLLGERTSWEGGTFAAPVAPYTLPHPDWNAIPTGVDASIAWATTADSTVATTLMLDLRTFPNPWYLNSLDAAPYQATGASLAGVPLVLSGSNRDHTWAWQGFTAPTQSLQEWNGRDPIAIDGDNRIYTETQQIEIRGETPEAFVRAFTPPLRLVSPVGTIYAAYNEEDNIAGLLAATMAFNTNDAFALERALNGNEVLYHGWLYDGEFWGERWETATQPDLVLPDSTALIENMNSTTDPNSTRWVPLLNAIPSDNLIVQRAQEQLGAWNGVMTPDLPGATLYRVVRAFTLRDMLADELGEELAQAYLSQTDGKWVEPLLDDPTHPLWDDTRTPHVETRDIIMARAWEATHHYLGRRFGDVPHEWAWGRLHATTLRHPLASQFPIFERWLTHTIPLAGDSTTHPAIPDDPAHDFAPAAIPALKIILSPNGDLYFAYPGGQSAHLFHSQSNTFLESWAAGEFLKLEWNGQNEAVLKLIPDD